MPGRSVLMAYVRAVEADRPDVVYAMMGKDYQHRVTLALFRKLWKTYRSEMLADVGRIKSLMERPEKHSLSKGMDESSAAPVRLEASGKTKAGPVILVWRKGRWRVVSGPGTELAGAGVKGLLLALIGAVQSKDFVGFVNLLSDKRKEAFWRGVSRRVTALKAWLARGRITVRGDRIRIYYTVDSYVDLVREKGVWRVDDFN